jgi:hypothetical protein
MIVIAMIKIKRSRKNTVFGGRRQKENERNPLRATRGTQHWPRHGGVMCIGNYAATFAGLYVAVIGVVATERIDSKLTFTSRGRPTPMQGNC